MTGKLETRVITFDFTQAGRAWRTNAIAQGREVQLAGDAEPWFLVDELQPIGTPWPTEGGAPVEVLGADG